MAGGTIVLLGLSVYNTQKIVGSIAVRECMEA